jgi:hypothetical protein
MHPRKSFFLVSPTCDFKSLLQRLFSIVWIFFIVWKTFTSHNFTFYILFLWHEVHDLVIPLCHHNLFLVACRSLFNFNIWISLFFVFYTSHWWFLSDFLSWSFSEEWNYDHFFVLVWVPGCVWDWDNTISYQAISRIQSGSINKLSFFKSKS